MKIDAVRIVIVGDTPVAAYTDPSDANDLQTALKENNKLVHPVWCISVPVDPDKVEAVYAAHNADRQNGE